MSVRLSTVAGLVAIALTVAACDEEDSTETETEDNAAVTQPADTEATDTTALAPGDATGGEADATEEVDSVEIETDNAVTSPETTTQTVEVTPVSPATDEAEEDVAATQPRADDASGTAAETEETTSDTGAASQDATDVATEAATEGESPAVAARDETIEAAEEEGVVGALADQPRLAEALTPEGYDYDVVKTAIDGSEIPDFQKETLLTGLESAQEEPEVLTVMLEQVRTALGME